MNKRLASQGADAIIRKTSHYILKGRAENGKSAKSKMLSEFTQQVFKPAQVQSKGRLLDKGCVRAECHLGQSCLGLG